MSHAQALSEPPPSPLLVRALGIAVSAPVVAASAQAVTLEDCVAKFVDRLSSSAGAALPGSTPTRQLFRRLMQRAPFPCGSPAHVFCEVMAVPSLSRGVPENLALLRDPARARTVAILMGIRAPPPARPAQPDARRGAPSGEDQALRSAVQALRRACAETRAARKVLEEREERLPAPPRPEERTGVPDVAQPPGEPGAGFPAWMEAVTEAEEPARAEATRAALAEAEDREAASGLARFSALDVRTAQLTLETADALVVVWRSLWRADDEHHRAALAQYASMVGGFAGSPSWEGLEGTRVGAAVRSLGGAAAAASAASEPGDAWDPLALDRDAAAARRACLALFAAAYGRQQWAGDGGAGHEECYVAALGAVKSAAEEALQSLGEEYARRVPPREALRARFEVHWAALAKAREELGELAGKLADLAQHAASIPGPQTGLVAQQASSLVRLGATQAEVDLLGAASAALFRRELYLLLLALDARRPLF